MSQTRRLVSRILTEAEVIEIDKRASLATLGPWRVEREDHPTFAKLGGPVCQMDGDSLLTVGSRCDYGPYSDRNNAAFIASTREDVPRLIDSLRAAWEVITKLGGEIPQAPPEEPDDGEFTIKSMSFAELDAMPTVCVNCGKGKCVCDGPGGRK